MFSKKVLIASLLAIVALIGLASLTLAQPPSATISSPATGATVSGKVAIQGTAAGVGFGYYKVEFKGGSDWVLTDGQVHKSAVSNGTLATWDTTTVSDGNYDVRLLAADNSGQYVTTQISVKVDNKTPAMQANAPRRGCLACHVQIAPDGRYTLYFEAEERAAARGGKHPVLPNGFNTKLAECLTCHASSGDGDKGAGAPLSLRAIVHPAHMFSKPFVEHYNGGCFTCHNVDAKGEFKVLYDKMDVNEKGVPNSK